MKVERSVPLNRWHKPLSVADIAAAGAVGGGGCDTAAFIDLDGTDDDDDDDTATIRSNDIEICERACRISRRFSPRSQQSEKHKCSV